MPVAAQPAADADGRDDAEMVEQAQTQTAAAAASATAAAATPVSPTSVASAAATSPPGKHKTLAKLALRIEPTGLDSEAAEAAAEAEETKSPKKKRTRILTEKAAALRPPPAEAASAAAAATAADASPAEAAPSPAVTAAAKRAQKKAIADAYKIAFTKPTPEKPTKPRSATKPSTSNKSAKSKPAPAAAAAATAAVKTPGSSHRKSTSAVAASAPSEPILVSVSLSSSLREALIRFPPPPRHIPESAFEDDGFQSFMSRVDDSAARAIRTSKPPPLPLTHAPSSQPLHAVRVQIYRELAEEYLGRYMKETPDAEEHPEGVAAVVHTPAKHYRRAKHAPVSKVDARSPEQLRMIFCELFNQCEADRVPSTAGLSALTGLTMVNPVDPAHPLTSFAASDSASMTRSYTPRTFEDFQERLTHSRQQQQKRPTSPLPINPNFDLYQYAPIIASDEYEEIVDEFRRRKVVQ